VAYVANNNVWDNVSHGAHNSSCLCVSEVGVKGSMRNYNCCLCCGRVLGYADPTMPMFCNLECQLLMGEHGPVPVGQWQRKHQESLIEFQERVRKRFEERKKEKRKNEK